jgi:glutamyl-tRNA reductase
VPRISYVPVESMDDRQRAAVDALSRGIVNTLLHAPTIRLKELADLGGAEDYADAIRDLFDLAEDDDLRDGPSPDVGRTERPGGALDAGEARPEDA